MRKDSKQGGYWEGKEGGWEKDSLRATADHRDCQLSLSPVSVCIFVNTQQHTQSPT